MDLGDPQSGPGVMWGRGYEVCVSELCVLPFLGGKVATAMEGPRCRRTSGVEATPRPQPQRGGLLADLPCSEACGLGASATVCSL